MNALQYLEKMKDFQESLLRYFDGEENAQNVILFMKDQFQRNQKEEIKATLKIILQVVNNYLRLSSFYTKIKNLLSNFKKEFEQTFSNFELFDFFKSSKLLLLFFLKESILTFDQSIVLVINDNEYWEKNYIKYFLPECQPFIFKALYDEIHEDLLKDGADSFEEKRENGENERFICNLIRNDLIDDFICHINQTNTSLSTIIKPSIFETNELLNSKKSSSLIEYSAFYGSIQIFKYLQLNNIQLTPSLWNYAIHGKNAEIIQILEENNVGQIESSFLIDSVKFYSNDIAYYLIDKFEENNISPLNFWYDNYEFVKRDNLENVLFYSCKYNYIYLVDLLLKTADIDINQNNILFSIFHTEIFFFNNF